MPEHPPKPGTEHEEEPHTEQESKNLSVPAGHPDLEAGATGGSDVSAGEYPVVATAESASRDGIMDAKFGDVHQGHPVGEASPEIIEAARVKVLAHAAGTKKAPKATGGHAAGHAEHGHHGGSKLGFFAVDVFAVRLLPYWTKNVLGTIFGGIAEGIAGAFGGKAGGGGGHGGGHGGGGHHDGHGGGGHH